MFNTERTSEGIIDNGPGLEDDVFTAGVVIAGASALLTTTVDRDSTTLGKELFQNGKVGDGSPNSGATFVGSGERNYIASDVYQNTQRTILGKTTSGIYTEIGLFALRIHETGNAISDLRNRLAQGTKNSEYGIRDKLIPINGYGAENKRFGINDPDAGAALERCVFGGIVNLRTGRVGTSRGL